MLQVEVVTLSLGNKKSDDYYRFNKFELDAVRCVGLEEIALGQRWTMTAVLNNCVQQLSQKDM